jgi:hypothetical protein
MSTTVEKNAIRAFDGWAEVACLAFPMIGILFAIGQVDKFYSLSGIETHSLSFWEQVLFLTSAHNAFTFILWAQQPEVRKFFSEHNKRVNGRDLATIVLICLACVGAVLGIRAIHDRHLASVLTAIFLQSFLIATQHHSIKQHLGISLIYNAKLKQKVELDETELKNTARSERFERKLYWLILVSQLGWFVMFSPESLSKAIFHLTHGWSVPIYRVLYYTHPFLALPIAAFLLADLFVFRMPIRKVIFNLRLLLFPLASAFTGLAMVRMTHAVEYFFVFRQMASVRAKKNIYIMTALLVGYITFEKIMIETHLNSHHFQRWSILFAVLYASAIAHSMVHYHMDRVMFRMRDPLSRKHIGPLIWPASESAIIP